MEYEITQREFELFRDYIYDTAGITLLPHKITLVRGRLTKRLRALHLPTFQAYYDYLLADTSGKELLYLIDAISTNVTSFFREPGQWEFLDKNLDSFLAKKKEKVLRIWSAACSSGEEPYSLAMFFSEHLGRHSEWKVKILATDISPDILSKASEGMYPAKQAEGVPKHYLTRYFAKQKEATGVRYAVVPELKEMVLFRMFNLIHGDFSLFQNRFDMIFCRNVMIYFDNPSRMRLIGNFAKLLERGSYLFVGHSESLMQNKEQFKLLNASIYERI